MKAILFDGFSGASGNMILAALVSLGANKERIKEYIERVANVKVEFRKKNIKGISSCYAEIHTLKESNLSFDEIIKRIKYENIPEKIISDAISIFKILGNAESKVHGIPIKKLHFHEIGQEDAIADIIGVCAGFYELKLYDAKIQTTPISVGKGYVEFSHGFYPIPTPATLEILKNYSLKWQLGPVNGELLTPTGAAIIAHFVNDKATYPIMRTEKIGYGAGTKSFEIPNILRIILGETDESLIFDDIEMLETNIDDVTGQILGNLIDELLLSGAKDVAIIPATMKKGRTGHIIKVISKRENSEKLARKIIEQTGSLGVRVIQVKHRIITKREINKIEISINGISYQISVKIARDIHGCLLNISAEFDDCKRVAIESKIPVREVIRIAENEARKRFF